MYKFDYAFDLLMKHEGGYVNDPHDSGGETKFGISQKSYPDIDISSLTEEGAKAIYKRDFWDSINLDDFPFKSIAILLFDIGVNIGMKNATKCLQGATRGLANLEIDVDGVIGKQTLESLHLCDETRLLWAFQCVVAGYYIKINNSRYQNGWLNRIFKTKV